MVAPVAVTVSEKVHKVDMEDKVPIVDQETETAEVNFTAQTISKRRRRAFCVFGCAALFLVIGLSVTSVALLVYFKHSGNQELMPTNHKYRETDRVTSDEVDAWVFPEARVISRQVSLDGTSILAIALADYNRAVEAIRMTGDEGRCYVRALDVSWDDAKEMTSEDELLEGQQLLRRVEGDLRLVESLTGPHVLQHCYGAAVSFLVKPTRGEMVAMEKLMEAVEPENVERVEVEESESQEMEEEEEEEEEEEVNISVCDPLGSGVYSCY